MMHSGLEVEWRCKKHWEWRSAKRCARCIVRNTVYHILYSYSLWIIILYAVFYVVLYSLHLGILPVAVLWGLIWIFAVKMKGEKNNTAIQAECRSCGDLADTAKGWTGPNCSFICQECIEIALCLLEEYRNKKN